MSLFSIFKRRPVVTAEDAASFGLEAAARAFAESAKVVPGPVIVLTLTELADLQQDAYTHGMTDMVAALQRIRSTS